MTVLTIKKNTLLSLSDSPSSALTNAKAADSTQISSTAVGTPAVTTSQPTEHKTDPEIEKKVLLVLCDISLDIPSESSVIAEHTSRMLGREVELTAVEALLKKFAAQSLIRYLFQCGHMLELWLRDSCCLTC